MVANSIKARMEKVLENVRADVATIRIGRATPSLVEDIVVAVYGGTQEMRVLEVASITASDSTSLLISPWDKSISGEIRKGIEAANLGFNPVLAGDDIRINLSPLTQEDRERYVKLLHQKLEDGKIRIRQVRQDGMRDIKADENLSEDEVVLQEKKLQQITDEFIGKIEEIGDAKEKELRSL